MLTKLTQKEYLDKLKTSNCFIQAVTTHPLEEVVQAVMNAKELPICHEYIKVEKRSKVFVFTRKDGSKCYRDFIGKNEYYSLDDLLLHVNVNGIYTYIFINL